MTFFTPVLDAQYTEIGREIKFISSWSLYSKGQKDIKLINKVLLNSDKCFKT